MDEKEFQYLKEIIELILDTYSQHPYIPMRLYQFWHPRVKQVNAIKNQVQQMGEREELIDMLDQQRYFMAVHTNSRRLRGKVQDALLEIFLFEADHIKKYEELVKKEKKVDAFLQFIEQDEEINRYKAYFKKQRAVYGRFIERLSDEEITLAAKGGIINGLLIERWGVKKTLQYGFHYIRQELTELKKNKVEAGFLDLKVIEGYLEKMDFLLHPANEIYHDNAALVQNSRYLLDDLLNSAVVMEDAKAHYPEHQFLINACYWLDELFLVVKSKVDVELTFH